MTQRVIEITSALFVAEESLDNVNGWSEIFGNDHPVSLEIGCGTGDFIAELARRHPQRNFLATDIYNKGCLKTCRKLEAAGLTNVRVLRMEARHLLQNFFGKESLDALYINCPDPWPKKRHRSRRLVQRPFLDLALYFLRPGGSFYFATDFQDYGEEVADLFEQTPGYLNQFEAPFSHMHPGYPSSKYMERFLQLGQPIFYVHQKKDADFTVDPQLLETDQGGFRTHQLRRFQARQKKATGSAAPPQGAQSAGKHRCSTTGCRN